jgi:hypothetical protein
VATEDARNHRAKTLELEHMNFLLWNLIDGKRTVNELFAEISAYEFLDRGTLPLDFRAALQFFQNERLVRLVEDAT